MYLFRLTAALLAMLYMAALNLIETRAGLPNTCTKCGARIEGAWFAKSVDAARAGQGQCYACAGKKKPEATPEDAMALAPEASEITALRRQLKEAQAQIAALSGTAPDAGKAEANDSAKQDTTASAQDTEVTINADHDGPDNIHRPGARRTRG